MYEKENFYCFGSIEHGNIFGILLYLRNSYKVQVRICTG